MNFISIHPIAVAVSILLTAGICVHTLFRCSSDKKNYFLICLCAMLVQMTGHLLELISGSADGAFTAIRVVYLGIGLLIPSLLFFVAGYCEVRLHTAFRIVVIVLSLAFVLGAWTTDTTGLLYASYGYDPGVTNCITYAPGSAIWLFRLFPTLVVLLCFVMLVWKLLKSRGNYRKTLLLLTLSIMLIFVTETMYGVMLMLNPYAPLPHLTPYAQAITAVLLCIGVIKYDMFDSSPISSIQAMDTISEAVILLDENLNYLSANSAAHKLLPWLREMKTDGPVFASPHWPLALSASAFTCGAFSADFSVTGDDTRYFHASVHPFEAELSRKKHWSILIQDITESENFIKRLEEAAYTDTLTGLYNRRHFAEIAAPFIERAKRMEQPYYVMMADLDLFKNVNDEYGHLAGDAVLRNTASIMKATIRSYDILARWGGEEFIFLITDSDPDSVLALAERIRQNVGESVCKYGDHELKITISIGIARNDGDDDVTSLVLRADEALYSSKQNGRNRVTMWEAPEK